jgi:hypothetical protein
MDEDPNQPPALNYEPRQRRDSGAGASLLMLFGMFLGVALVIVAGCGVMSSVGYPYIGGPTLPSPAVKWWAPTLFFAILIGSTVGVVAIYRTSRQWFFIGLLFGIGVMSLVEGLCFANP